MYSHDSGEAARASKTSSTLDWFTRDRELLGNSDMGNQIL